MASNKQQQKKQPTQTNSKAKSESSLVRFSKIPAVEFSIFVSLGLYNTVKSNSKLLNNVLSQVEKVATSTYDRLKPLASGFEKQVETLDSWGNLLLDKLESTVPVVVTFQPGLAYSNVVNSVNSWRTYATDKVSGVLNYDINKTVSGTLKKVDVLLDEYLPGGQDETEEDSVKESDNWTSQLGGLGTKLRRRLVKRAQNIQRLVL